MAGSNRGLLAWKTAVANEPPKHDLLVGRRSSGCPPYNHSNVTTRCATMLAKTKQPKCYLLRCRKQNRFVSGNVLSKTIRVTAQITMFP